MVFAIGAAAVLAGTVYALVVPLGLPQDEAAHLGTAAFVARHLALPILGRPGTNYEAQQAPLYYVLAGAMLRLAGMSVAGGARLLRTADVLLLIPLIVLTFRIGRRLAPGIVWLAPAMALVTALNPTILGVFGAVKNDALAVVLTIWIIERALSWPRRVPPSWTQGALVGLLAGAAMLTKASAVYVLPAVAVWWAVRFRGRSVTPIVVAIATAGVTAGWWVARNVILYGDLSGHAGYSSLGPQFPHPNAGAVPLNNLRAIRFLIDQLARWLWLPTNHYSPINPRSLLLNGMLYALCLLPLVGIVAWFCHDGRSFSIWPAAAGLLLVGLVFDIVTFVYGYDAIMFISWRVAFGFYPAVAAATCAGYATVVSRLRIPAPAAVAVALAVLIGLNVVTLAHASQLSGSGLTAF